MPIMIPEEDPIHFQLLGLTFTVYRQFLLRTAILVWLIMLVVLTVAQRYFGYEMTNADLPGGLISGFLFAYLLTILIK